MGSNYGRPGVRLARSVISGHEAAADGGEEQAADGGHGTGH